MQIKKVTQDTIRYNPVTNMFEAIVELKAEGVVYHYPCAVEGALMMPLAMAAFKLTQQAKHRHATGNSLYAHRDEAGRDRTSGTAEAGCQPLRRAA